MENPVSNRRPSFVVSDSRPSSKQKAGRPRNRSPCSSSTLLIRSSSRTKARLINADYPGSAVKRVREELGEDVIALFGQGCYGNMNALWSTHEKTEKAGRKLGDAVLNAMKETVAIKTGDLDLRSAQSMLPSHPLLSEEL